MKLLLVVILLFAITLSGCNLPDNRSVLPPAASTTPPAASTTPPAASTPASAASKFEIVSTCSQDISLSDESVAEDSNKAFEYYMTYAEYVHQGIQLVDAEREYGKGKLIYTITDVYIIDNINDNGASANGLSIDTKMHWSEENGWQELNKPYWLKDDGSFASDISIIMVDISVYNDRVKLSDGSDKYGNSIHPYTFEADDLIWLSNMQPSTGKRNYLYTAINYFSLMGTDPNYAYQYQLLPGETIEFTVGFVLGPEFTFQSDDTVFLSNTCGNTNGVYIDFDLGKDEYEVGNKD